MIGKSIRHHKILEKLGEGGMGVVYKAEDTKLKRTVALKFLPADLTRDPEAKDRFIREAQTASAMDHPNVCTIHEIDESEDGQMYIAMAFYSGETLKEKIESGMMELEEVIDIATQIGRGLAKAHEQGIVHRDIKPANILMTEDGQAKIVDFGLAKLAGQTGLTRTGTTVGTVAYMSPEQARGHDIDHRTDIWSFGTVLYEMITGERAFKGEYEQAVIYSIMNEEPEPMANFRSDVPQELEWIIQKTMYKDASERYQSLDEILAELQILRGEEITGRIAPPKPLEVAIKKKLLKTIVLPVCLVFTLALAFMFLRPLLFEQVLHSEPKPIAVISFVNQTGDNAYDYLQSAIPNLLITSLEQSPYLRVATWERMYDLLKQLGQEEIEIIDKELGFELCRMDGIDAIVLGSFVKAGNMFATDVKILDVATKDLLKSASFKGEGEESILKTQIDEMTQEIVRGVGLGEPGLEETMVEIAEVTTTSMEAYTYFLRGRENCEKFYYDDALPFLEQAIALDSTFAAAHLYLGWAYDWLHNKKARDAAYEKAMTFSQKATEKERFYIEATYASVIEPDPEKRFRILTELAERYPKEKRVHFYLAEYYKKRKMFSKAVEEFNTALELDANYGLAINQLAYTYADSGDFSKAVEYFEKYASVSPGDANPFDSMGEICLKAGKFDEAIVKYKKALEIKPDFGADWNIAYIYALKEDYHEAMKWTDQFIAMAPSPGVRLLGHIWKGLYHYWLGNLDKCLADFATAENLGNVIESEFLKAHVERMKGWVYYDRGKPKLGRSSFKNWFDFFTKFHPPYAKYYTASNNFYLGLVNLKEGQIDSARFRLAEIDSLLPDLSPKHQDGISFCRHVLYSEVLLASDSLEKVVDISEKAASPGTLPLMSPLSLIPYNVPFIKDVSARAYARKGEMDKAIAEYEMLITFDPDRMERTLIHPLYHYRLARLYEEQKFSSVKAIEHYEKFLDIWKNADEDLPELIDAKKRVAKLSG